jgi:hypothetical protein
VKIGSSAKRSFDTIGWQLVELPPGMSVSGAQGVSGSRHGPGRRTKRLDGCRTSAGIDQIGFEFVLPSIPAGSE